MTAAATTRHRPRRRLRRAVRAADRPPGARGAGLQRDRPAHHAGRGDAGARAGGDHPVRRARVGLRRRRARRSTRRCSRRACRPSASATASRRWRWRWAARSRSTGLAEFGGTTLKVQRRRARCSGGLPGEQSVWMCHGDAVSAAPDGLRRVAPRPRARRSRRSRTSARRLAGVQFHPEVHAHRARPDRCSSTSCTTSPAAAPTWTMTNVIDEQVDAIRAQVGDERVICGLSGGVDSAVAAALVHRAVGDQLTCVFVDHGLLRKGEAEQVERDYRRGHRRAARRWPTRRSGSSTRSPASPTPRRSARSIGREFIRVFEEAAREVVAEAGAHGETVEFLVQGTLYPDVVESGGGTGTANIKSHHNVGGLPDDLQFALVEPLRDAVQGRGAPGRARARAARARSSGGSRSRARASGIRIIGEVTAGAARRAARGRRDRPRGADRGPGSTARSGSARSCCSATCGRSACRATGGRTATRSCCARCRPRTR